MSELDKKIKQSIKLLQTTCRSRGIVELAYSGGKDSDVILQLAKESGIEFRPIYKQTTIDPKGTIAHVKEMGVDIVKPKISFFQLISKYGFPDRHRRFCCAHLKEYKILDTCVIGIRRDESVKRSLRYIEPTACRVFSKKEKVYQIFPILEWTLEDIAFFIKDRKLTLAPHYYNKDLSIDFSKRLGCMGCPLKSQRQRISEFKENPGLFRAWIIAGYNYYNEDVYRQMSYYLFSKENWIDFCSPKLFPINYKSFLEDYFNVHFNLHL